MSEKKHIEEAIRKAVRGILSEMMTEDDAMDGSKDETPAAAPGKTKKAGKDLMSMSDQEFDAYLANATKDMEMSDEEYESHSGGIDPAGGAPFKSKYMRGDDEDPLDKHLGINHFGDNEEELSSSEVTDKELKDKGHTYVKGGNEHSQEDVATAMGVSAPAVAAMEKVAKNKFSNRAAYMPDDMDEQEILLKYIQQVPEKQRRSLVDEFKAKVQPDTFVNDYIEVLLKTNDGGPDDISPKEAKAMRDKPEWVVDSPQYKAYATKMNTDMMQLISSEAFYDHVREKTNFQNFINDMVQTTKAERGITDDTKDKDGKADKGEFAKFLNKFGGSDIGADQLDEPETVAKLHKTRKEKRLKDALDGGDI